LITDLSESQYMRVVSRQRLYDILELLGKQDLKVIDKTVASKVAQKAGVKWILTGSILQIEPNIVLTSDVSEASTGEILATQRITGEKGEELFSVVDKLSAHIKDDLSLPEQAKSELDKPVADVTTHSTEAYSHYLEGVDNYNKVYSTQAEKSFRKALEIDSTFAMAYYWLSHLTTGSERKEIIGKAVKYSNKVSWKEKRWINSADASYERNWPRHIEELKRIVERYPEEKEAFYSLGMAYFYQLGEYEEAVHYFNKALEIDPLYKDPYNELTYTYDAIGDFEKAIWAINQYISLAPNNANPYDTRADLYAFNGKIDQAIESYKKALEIKPDFYMSLRKLGHMYLFKRQYAKPESCYKELASSNDKDTRSIGRTCLALIPLYEGKFNRALEVLDDGVAADRMEKVEWGGDALKHFLKSYIHEEKKNLTLALKEYEKCVEIWHRAYPDDLVTWRDYYVWLLAENNDFEKAEEVALALKKDIAEKDQTLMWAYRFAIGCIELSKGNLEASVTNFEKVAKDVPDFNAHFYLAKTYLEARRLGDAVTEFEKMLSRYDDDRALNTIRAVKAHYLLGLAYEKSGWNKKAIEQYEEFLEIWKDADPGIPEVEDAKERLEKLKAKSSE